MKRALVQRSARKLGLPPTMLIQFLLEQAVNDTGPLGEFGEARRLVLLAEQVHPEKQREARIEVVSQYLMMVKVRYGERAFREFEKRLCART